MKLKFACLVFFMMFSYSNALGKGNNVENALRDCFKNMKITVNKQPNLDKIEECMTQKGFVKPFIKTADGKIMPKIKFYK